MTLKTKGVILKISGTLHDNRLLFILTEEYGRLQVFDNRASGGGKRRNTLDLYTYCEFILYENKGKYTLNSATPIENFYKLRENLPNTTLAGYFSQLCLYLTQDDTVSVGGLCSLMLNSLYLLTKHPDESRKVKTVFEWKTVLYGGFAPVLTGCDHISFDIGVLFSLADGGLYCPDCLPIDATAPAYTVSASLIKAVGFVLEQPPAKAFSFRLGDETLKLMEQIGEEYLHYHTGQTFSALELYKVIG